MEDLEARTIADIISNTRIGDPIPGTHSEVKHKRNVKDLTQNNLPEETPLAQKVSRPVMIIVDGRAVI